MSRAEHHDFDHYHYHTQQKLTQKDRPHKLELIDTTILHRKGQKTTGIEGSHLRKDDEHTENTHALQHTLSQIQQPEQQRDNTVVAPNLERYTCITTRTRK